MTIYSKYVDSIDNLTENHKGYKLTYMKDIDLSNEKRTNHTEKIKFDKNFISVNNHILRQPDVYICEIGIGFRNPEDINEINVMLEIGGSKIYETNLFDHEFIFKVAKIRDEQLYIPITNCLFSDNHPYSYIRGLLYHDLRVYLQKKFDNIYLFIDWCQSINANTDIYDKRILQLSKYANDSFIRSYFFYYSDFGQHANNYEIRVTSTYTIETDTIIPRDVYYYSFIHRTGRRISPLTINKLMDEYDEKPVHYTKTNTKITKYNTKKNKLVNSAYRKIIGKLSCDNVANKVLEFLRPKMRVIEHKYSNKNIDLLRSDYVDILSEFTLTDLAKCVVNYLLPDINSLYRHKYAYYIDMGIQDRYYFDIELESDDGFYPNIMAVRNNILRSAAGMSGVLYST